MIKSKTRNHDIDIEKKKSNAGDMSHPECVGRWCSVCVWFQRHSSPEKGRRNSARCAVEDDGPGKVQYLQALRAKHRRWAELSERRRRGPRGGRLQVERGTKETVASGIGWLQRFPRFPICRCRHDEGTFGDAEISLANGWELPPDPGPDSDSRSQRQRIIGCGRGTLKKMQCHVFSGDDVPSLDEDEDEDEDGPARVQREGGGCA